MASTTAPAIGMRGTSSGYQTMLVLLLGLNMGVVFLDRGAFGLLAPMIQPEFRLSNAQVGMIGGILAATWALSSIAITRLADITGRSKLLLVAATIVFSIASISSGLAIGLMTLLAARALMGFAEGGLPPLSTHIVTSEVAPERRGLAIGMLSTIGINAIPLLGPLVIVGVGTVWGWRSAFWVAGVPGLAVAGLIWLFVRNPEREPVEQASKGSFGPLLKVRNIRFTLGIGALHMAFVANLLGFLPLYLVKVLGLSNARMGLVMTALQAVAVFYGFFFPMLSDRFGRKAAILGSYALSVLALPLLAFSHGSLPLVLAGAMMVFAGGAGAGILIMVVIPGESAPPHIRATAMGFNAAVGEMIGAGATPVLVGGIADRFGLGVLPWLLLGFAVLLGLLALGLTETAPKVAERRAAAALGGRATPLPSAAA